MAITSVTIDGLEIHSSSSYSVANATADALLSSVPYDAVTVELAGAPDYYVRSQITAKRIPLAVFIHGTTYTDRRTRYDALVAKFGEGLHTLRWTDDGTTHQLTVTTGPLMASAWLTRAAAELTAWDPRPVLV